MTRRSPYSKFEKENQQRPDRVQGKGDVLYRGFECLNPDCTNFITVQDNDCHEHFRISCIECDYKHSYDGSQEFFNFSLIVDNETLESGTFSITHRSYLDAALRMKFCLICYTLKPLAAFANHKARNTGKQGECTLCKDAYNSIKNKTRIDDQHREAANKRRLYVDITGSDKIDRNKVSARFAHRCFKCNTDLSQDMKNAHLDHTLPVYYLWPLTTDNASLLCSSCNNAKTNKWPSDFYNDTELKRLTILTGIPYETLSRRAHFNPEALKHLEDPEALKRLLTKFAAYEREIFQLRNRIESLQGIDIFQGAKIHPAIVERANVIRSRQSPVQLDDTLDLAD